VLLADGITVICSAGYLPFRRIFGQDAALLIEVENVTWNTANWCQRINNTELLIAAIASQLEQSQEHIGATIYNRKVSRDANTCNYNQATNCEAGDLQISNLTPVHETNIEQYADTKLYAKWRGRYQVTVLALRLGTHQMTELDVAELAGWIDGSRLRKIFICNERVHGT
jgi:hypothetical protein